MKKWLSLIFLVATAYGQQINTDLIPTTSGLNIGHTNQRWNGYFVNLNITGNCTINGSSCLGAGTVTGASSNGGLVLSGNKLGLFTNCSVGQVEAWNGTAWACANSGSVFTSGTITPGQIALWFSTTALQSVIISGDSTMNSSGVMTNVGLKGVPFCNGYSPVTLQVVQYTTASSPNPCYTSTAVGAGTITGSTTHGGLVTTSTTLGLPLNCSVNQTEQWNGTDWVCATISGTVAGQVKGQPPVGITSSTFSSSPGVLYVSAFCGSTTSCNPGGGITDESTAIAAAVTQLKNGGASGPTGHIIDDMCAVQTWSVQPFTGFAGLFETQSNCSIVNTHIISLDGVSTITLPSSMQWKGTGGNGFAQVPTNSWVQACNPILHPCVNGGFVIQQGAIASTTYTAGSSELTITLTAGAPFTTCAANGICSQVTTPSLTAVNAVQQYRLLCINNSSQATNNGCWTYKTTVAFGAPQSFKVNVPGSGLVSCAASCGTVYLETPLVAIGNGGGGGVFWTRIDGVVLNGSYMPGVSGAVNGQGQEGTGMGRVQAFNTPAYFLRLDQSAAFGGAAGGDTNSGDYGPWAGNFNPIVCKNATCACQGKVVQATGGHGVCSSTTVGVPGTVNLGDWMSCGVGGTFPSISPDPCTNPNFVGYPITGAAQNQGPGRVVGHITASISDKGDGGGHPIKQLQGSGTITGTQTATTASGFMCIGSHCTIDDPHMEYFSTALEIGGNLARNATWELAYRVPTAGGALVPLTAGVLVDGGFSAFENGGTGVDIGESGAGPLIQDVSIRGLNAGLGSGNALVDNIAGTSCSDATFTYFLGHGAQPMLINSCSTVTNLTAPSIADSSITQNGIPYGGVGGLFTNLPALVTPPLSVTLCETPNGISSSAPSWCLPGTSGRALGGANSTDSIGGSDCANLRIGYTGSVAVAVTLPTPGTLGDTQCSFVIANNLSTVNSVTITPATWNCNGNPTCTVLNGQIASFSVDPTGASNWIADIKEQGLSAGSGMTFTRSSTGLAIASSGGGASANTALSNLAAVAVNLGLTPGVTNSIDLGSNSLYWANLWARAINCGIAGTASCTITGGGSTSGTATLTWPAIAGTVANPIVSSNALQLPNTSKTNPSLVFANSATSGFYSNSATIFCAANSNTDITCWRSSTDFELGNGMEFSFSQSAQGSGTVGPSLSVIGTGSTENMKFSAPVLMSQCKVTTDISLPVNTATTICSWNLPNSAQVWGWQCGLHWNITAGTGTNTIAVSVNPSQVPAATTSASAEIKSTNTNTATEATVALSASGGTTVLTSGTITPGASTFLASTYGTLSAPATSGTFAIQMTAAGTTATAAAGGTCQLY